MYRYEKSLSALVDTRVKKAANNLLQRAYFKDLIAGTSLRDFKQGTSQNETWHKYLSKGFPQFSGSVSAELLEAVILHLQWQYNCSIDCRAAGVQVLTTLPLWSTELIQEKVEHHRKTAEDYKKENFNFKKLNFEYARKEDIEDCKLYIQQLVADETIGTSLIHQLTHYKFSNVYSKQYIRLLLHEINK